MGAQQVAANARISLPIVMLDNRLFPKPLLALSQAVPGGVTWEALGSLSEAIRAAPSGPVVAVTSTMSVRLGAALWRGEDAREALARIIAQTEQTLFDLRPLDGRGVLLDRADLVGHPSSSLQALAQALEMDATAIGQQPAPASAQLAPRFALLADMIIAHDAQARALAQRFADAHLVPDKPAPAPPNYAVLQKAAFQGVSDAAFNRINGALRGQLRKLRLQADEDHTTIGILQAELDQARRDARQADDLRRAREGLLGHLLLSAETSAATDGGDGAETRKTGFAGWRRTGSAD